MVLLNFEKFIERVKNELREYLPEEFQGMEISIHQQKKSHDNHAELTITDGRQKSSSVVNLEDYYWDYCNGRRFYSIIGAIAESFEMDNAETDLKMISDFEYAKDLLFIKVSNAMRNGSNLWNVPYTLIEDLAVTYHLKIQDEMGDVTTEIVTNQMLKAYGVSKEVLHQTAMQNSEKLFPANIYNLNEHRKQNFVFEMKRKGKSEAEIADSLKEYPKPEENLLIVVTNNVCFEGAVVIFYPGIMDKIAEITEGDYFILPSSLHEMVILPDRGEFSPEYLANLLSEANATDVAPWDRLIDEVYHYDPIDRVFEKASAFEERIAQKTEAERNAKKQSIMDKLGEKKEAAKAMIGEKKTPFHTAEVSL